MDISSKLTGIFYFTNFRPNQHGPGFMDAMSKHEVAFITLRKVIKPVVIIKSKATEQATHFKPYSAIWNPSQGQHGHLSSHLR
jgi:hypothetical protein